MNIDTNKIDIKLDPKPEMGHFPPIVEARWLKGLTIFGMPADPSTIPNQPFFYVRMEVGYQY